MHGTTMKTVLYVAAMLGSPQPLGLLKLKKALNMEPLKSVLKHDFN
jgi:hypothetical protein